MTGYVIERSLKLRMGDRNEIFHEGNAFHLYRTGPQRCVHSTGGKSGRIAGHYNSLLPTTKLMDQSRAEHVATFVLHKNPEIKKPIL